MPASQLRNRTQAASHWVTSSLCKTHDFADVRSAWNRFTGMCGRPLPRRAAIAVAGTVNGETIRFTNNAWTIRPNTLAGELGLETTLVLNDVEAAAHAAMYCGEEHFLTIGPCAPPRQNAGSRVL
jgi:glucokinase